jgi:hypothetical protein
MIEYRKRKIIKKAEALNPTHEQIQAAIIEWSNLHPICSEYLFHIPNEGKRSLYLGKKLRDQGMRAGVSDLFLSYPSSPFHGYYIEIKTEGDKLSTVQQIWAASVQKVGYKFSIFKDAETCINSIRHYLKETIVTRRTYKEIE